MPYRERDLLQDLRIKLNRLRNGGALEDTLSLYLFAIIRSYIERHDLHDTFPVTKFYADWMVHPKLDRNKVARQIVLALMETLKNEEIPVQEKTRELNRRLGHTALHTELRDFFNQNNLDQMILGDENWRLSFGQISRLTVSKPIDLKGHEPAAFAAGEIPGVEYDGYPVFWLHGEPGARVDLFIACVQEDNDFSEALIANNATNGTVIFQAGLYWDAL